MRPVRPWITVPLLLALGCGGGGGGGHSASTQPTRTATPIATPSPVPTVSVALTLTSSIDVVGASFTVGYEPGRVALLGSGAQAQCRLGSNDTLAVNDDDNGTLRVALVPADPLQRQTLTLPTTLTCDFAENGGSVSAGDLRVGTKKVAVLNASSIAVAGDASKLAVQ